MQNEEFEEFMRKFLGGVPSSSGDKNTGRSSLSEDEIKDFTEKLNDPEYQEMFKEQAKNMSDAPKESTRETPDDPMADILKLLGGFAGPMPGQGADGDMFSQIFRVFELPLSGAEGNALEDMMNTLMGEVKKAQEGEENRASGRTHDSTDPADFIKNMFGGFPAPNHKPSRPAGFKADPEPEKAEENTAENKVEEKDGGFPVIGSPRVTIKDEYLRVNLLVPSVSEYDLQEVRVTDEGHLLIKIEDKSLRVRLPETPGKSLTAEGNTVALVNGVLEVQLRLTSTAFHIPLGR